MKNLNRPPLFSRDIHEKLANYILATFISAVIIASLIKFFSSNFLVGILFAALLYAVFVLNYKYPRLRGQRFPKRK
jgi:Flp pilus assembly protein TadB